MRKRKDLCCKCKKEKKCYPTKKILFTMVDYFEGFWKLAEALLGIEFVSICIEKCKNYESKRGNYGSR
jgi:hypothetical protein